ncbi:MAG: FkbM family methyltransferase, partial [Bacteroidia bacterium]|nr:FkbM family methyltransferase [Bacteroidia bacterium]
SYRLNRPIDGNGKPIPWCTYPFIKFIEPRLQKEFVVFEFGGGNSTLWYAQRVQAVKSVENNKKWVDIISPQLPFNAEMIFKDISDNGEYVNEVYKGKNLYDIIIIDGKNRNDCVVSSLKCLKDNGIIVFDNTERSGYKDGINILKNNNFKRIDFYGMSPSNAHTTCTSIFYRSVNCLDI